MGAEEGCGPAEVKATGCREGKVFEGCSQDGTVGLYDGLTVGCEAQEDLPIQQKVQMDTQG